MAGRNGVQSLDGGIGFISSSDVIINIGRVEYLGRHICIWRGRVREKSGRDGKIKIAGLTIK